MVALRDAALSYAARGWAVFPLKPGDKTPLKGSGGFKDATTDADQIRAWWDRNPRYNIGIATGAVSGFVVIDTDNPDAEGYVTMQGDAPTRRQTTAKGRHRLYQHPGYTFRNTTALHGVAGVDIRGDGGYIVAAPSVHPTGVTYAWENESDLAPLPAWATRKPEQARPQTASTGTPYTNGNGYLHEWAERTTAQAVGAVAMARNGMRHDTVRDQAVLLGGLVAHGLITEDAIYRLLLSAVHTDGPKEEHNARQTIADGIAYGRARPLDLPPEPKMPGFDSNGYAVCCGAPVVVSKYGGGYCPRCKTGYKSLDPAQIAPPTPPDDQASGAAASGQPPQFGEQADGVLSTANRTDEGNAECFVSLYGDTYRYCGTRGLWLRWTGAYWQADDRKTTERAAIDTARQRYHAAAGIDDLETRKRAAAWAISSESQAKASATLRAAEKHLITLIDDYDNAPLLAAAANQTIDLLTGQARAGNREDMLSMALGTSYDPAATCQKWDQFIGEVFSGDPELVRYVQRAVGYSLTGDTSEQKLFLCYGNGANGKSVFLDTIAALLGDYAATAAFDTFDANKRSEATNDLAMLKGKRFVTITESEQDKRLAEARVKQITGGDSITCRFLHREFFTYHPTFKIWLAMNHLPTIRGTDRGIWRRIQVLPFLESFEGRENRKLPRELLQELPGILNWALQGLQDWHANGLGTCQAVQAATQEYKADQDKVGRWMSECVQEDPERIVSVAALWESYKAWCADNNVFAGSKKVWTSELSQRGYTSQKHQQKRQYIGLSLGDPPEDGTDGTDGTVNPVFPREEKISIAKTEKSVPSVPSVPEDDNLTEDTPPVPDSADALACQSAIDAGDLPAARRALIRLAAGDGATYRAYRLAVDRLAAQQATAPPAPADAADQAAWEVQ